MIGLLVVIHWQPNKKKIGRGLFRFSEISSKKDNKMETKEKKLLGLPSWGLSLLTAFVSLIFLFFFSALLVAIPQIDKNISEGIAYIFFNIIIAIACFFICKYNPKNVLYVPIICNAAGIISAIVEPNFWITDLWIFICSGWVLSLICSIIGRVVGRRLMLRIIKK